MAVTSIPAVSVEYIHVPVTASVTLDAQTVELLFLTGTSAPDGDTSWITASWEGVAATTRTCRVLTGPGTSVTMAPGKVNVWVRVTDDPEVPVRQAGQITVI